MVMVSFEFFFHKNLWIGIYIQEAIRVRGEGINPAENGRDRLPLAERSEHVGFSSG
jgi:hypothetical protein